MAAGHICPNSLSSQYKLDAMEKEHMLSLELLQHRLHVWLRSCELIIQSFLFFSLSKTVKKSKGVVGIKAELPLRGRKTPSYCSQMLQMFLRFRTRLLITLCSDCKRSQKLHSAVQWKYLGFQFNSSSVSSELITHVSCLSPVCFCLLDLFLRVEKVIIIILQHQLCPCNFVLMPMANTEKAGNPVNDNKCSGAATVEVTVVNL